MNVEIVSALGGAFVAGILTLGATLLSNHHNRETLAQQERSAAKKSRTAALRERGEELYVSVDKFSKAVCTAYLPLFSVMRGRISYNEYLELFNKSNPSSEYDASRLQMLVAVYFSQSEPAYNDMQSALRVVNRVVHDFEQAYRSGRNGELFIEPLSEAQRIFDNKAECLKECIAVELRALDA